MSEDDDDQVEEVYEAITDVLDQGQYTHFDIICAMGLLAATISADHEESNLDEIFSMMRDAANDELKRNCDA